MDGISVAEKRGQLEISNFLLSMQKEMFKLISSNDSSCTKKCLFKCSTKEIEILRESQQSLEMGRKVSCRVCGFQVLHAKSKTHSSFM